MHEYIEKYVCPTVVSSDFTGREQFRFERDSRHLIAFIAAENEYRANQRLPEFAHQLLLTAGVNCEFALGEPVMEGPGRHNIENLQIVRDADLAVIFVRRRALDSAKMTMIREYVYSGKPVLGIRTASHAFDVDPVSVAVQDAGMDHLSEGVRLCVWPQFDRDILGGNYQGHYGHLKASTVVSVVPGMEAHPLLKDVAPSGFTSPGWLYKNAPLHSPNAQVLLIGKTADMPAEPVLWINENRYGKALYTSLGHWDDWENEHFRQIMLHAVEYLLCTKKD
jgi:hypothetical protein